MLIIACLACGFFIWKAIGALGRALIANGASDESGTRIGTAKNARSHGNRGEPATFLVLPPADGTAWRPDSYKIAAAKTPDVLAVSRGGATLYAYKSQMHPARCDPSDKMPGNCVSFPNGQLIVANDTLMKELPYLGILRAWNLSREPSSRPRHKNK
jgi:hypothetical protein